jgi:hypothetical protein
MNDELVSLPILALFPPTPKRDIAPCACCLHQCRALGVRNSQRA